MNFVVQIIIFAFFGNVICFVCWLLIILVFYTFVFYDVFSPAKFNTLHST